MEHLILLNLNYLNVLTSQHHSTWLIKLIKYNKFDIIFVHNIEKKYIIDLIFILKKFNYNYKLKLKNDFNELIISKHFIKNFKILKIKGGNNKLLTGEININNNNILLCTSCYYRENTLSLQDDFNNFINYLENLKKNNNINYIIYSYYTDECILNDIPLWKNSYILSNNKNEVDKYTYNYKLNKNILCKKQSNNNKIIFLGKFSIIQYRLISESILFNSLNLFNHFPIILKLYYSSLKK